MSTALEFLNFKLNNNHLQNANYVVCGSCMCRLMLMCQLMCQVASQTVSVEMRGKRWYLTLNHMPVKFWSDFVFVKSSDWLVISLLLA